MGKTGHTKRGRPVRLMTNATRPWTIKGISDVDREAITADAQIAKVEIGEFIVGCWRGAPPGPLPSQALEQLERMGALVAALPPGCEAARSYRRLLAKIIQRWCGTEATPALLLLQHDRASNHDDS